MQATESPKSELFKEVTAPTSEGVQEKKTEETPKESPLAEQFQRIAKQEKYVSSERQKIEDARKAFEAEKSLAESYKSLKGKSPFEILEHFGITYEQLLDADKQRQTPLDPIAKRALEEVEKLRNELTSKEQEALKSRLSKAEIQLQADIDKEITSGEFDLIEKLDAKSAVREYMEELYETSGEIPSIKEACEAVTNYIATKYLSIKDSKWLKPKEETVTPTVVETITPESKTISNKMMQTSVRTDKPLSDAERMAAAIKVMHSFAK